MFDKFMEFLKIILEKIKIKTIMIIVFLFSLLLTIMPIKYKEVLHILKLTIEYQAWISLALLLSAISIIGIFIVFIIKITKNWMFSPKRRVIKYMIKDMSVEEKKLLIKTFFDTEKNRFKLEGKMLLQDGTIDPLISNNIIYQSAYFADMAYGWSFNLHTYVLKFLNKNIEKGNINIKEGMFKLEK